MNSSVSINASVVSAGVGFNVNQTRSTMMGGSWDIPNHIRRGMLEAFAIYDGFNFEIWNNPLLGSASIRGNGNAYNFNNGVAFAQTIL